MHWPGTNLIVELDCYEYHRTPQEFENDRWRDAHLKRNGYEVLRVTEVWLVTEEGRLQASVRGIDKLEGLLTGTEFLRVHRRFLVNLSCVRAIDRGDRGELVLIMDSTTRETVPVSRRNVPAVRRALGI